jgi:hypothetical protein
MTTLPLLHFGAKDGPVACALAAGELGARTSGLRRLADQSLRSREPIEGGERLRFTDRTQVERALREAVAAEASCCSFLTLTLRRAAGALELDVTGPPEARSIIAELFA